MRFGGILGYLGHHGVRLTVGGMVWEWGGGTQSDGQILQSGVLVLAGSS